MHTDLSRSRSFGSSTESAVSYTHLDVYKRQDEIILDALIMRNRIVEDIMAYKEANELQILQPEQEAKQKEWLEKRMEGRRHKDEVSVVRKTLRDFPSRCV